MDGEEFAKHLTEVMKNTEKHELTEEQKKEIRDIEKLIHPKKEIEVIEIAAMLNSFNVNTNLSRFDRARVFDLCESLSQKGGEAVYSLFVFMIRYATDKAMATAFYDEYGEGVLTGINFDNEKRLNDIANNIHDIKLKEVRRIKRKSCGNREYKGDGEKAFLEWKRQEGENKKSLSEICKEYGISLAAGKKAGARLRNRQGGQR